MIRLTQHFTLAEFFVSAAHPHLVRSLEPGHPFVHRLGLWSWHIGEPIRRYFGKPVIITSGYRSLELNEAVGGSETSQHKTGEAIDFQVLGIPSTEVYNWIEDSGIRPYQLILYRNEDGKDRHLHTSLFPSHTGPAPLRALSIRGDLTHFPEGTLLAR